MSISINTNIQAMGEMLLTQSRSLLSDVDYHKLLRIKDRQQKAKQHLASRYLLNRLHVNDCGRPAKLEFLADGSPMIIDSTLYCSISHSKNAVMVALSKAPIGIDVEFIKPRNINELADLFMSKQDQNKIKDINLDEKTNLFYERWCLVESIAKLKSMDLSSAYSLIQQESHKFCSHYDKIEGYQICVSGNNPINIKMLNT